MRKFEVLFYLVAYLMYAWIVYRPLKIYSAIVCAMLKQSNSTTKIILLYSQFFCSLYTQPSICLCLYFCFDLYLLCSIQKKDFFLCHTRYTNTTFSLSVSVQTLPFCQAHRSTTPTADVPFRGSKTYSCTTLPRNDLLRHLNWGAQILMEISSNV